MRAWVTVGLLAWCGSLLVSEPVFGEPRSERYEVPKHVVDFDGEARSGTFNATLARACGPPQRLSVIFMKSIATTSNGRSAKSWSPIGRAGAW